MSRLPSRYGRKKTNDSTRSFISHLHATADTHEPSVTPRVGEAKQRRREEVDTLKPPLQPEPLARVTEPDFTADEVIFPDGTTGHKLSQSKHDRKRPAVKSGLECNLPRKRIRHLQRVTDTSKHGDAHGRALARGREVHSRHGARHSTRELLNRRGMTDINVSSESLAVARADDVVALDPKQPSDFYLPSPPLTNCNSSTSPDPQVNPFIKLNNNSPISLKARMEGAIREMEGQMQKPTDRPRIASLPDYILLHILYLVPEPAIKDIFRPWLKNGMHRHGVFGISLSLFNNDLVNNDNVDLSFLRVSKHFYKLGVVAVYQMHQFVLSDPYPAEHWLRTIGPRNIGLVQCLALQIRTDWQVSRITASTVGNDWCWSPPFDKCKEESWLKILSRYIQPHHNLQTLVVNLFNWRSVKISYDGDPPCDVFHDEFDRERVVKSRMRLLQFLATQMRGIPETYVDDEKGVWLDAAAAQHLMARMQRPKNGPRQPVQDRRSVTLSRALARGKAYVARRNAQLAEAEKERRWIAQRLHGMDCSAG